MPYGEYGSKYNQKYSPVRGNYTSRTFTQRKNADFYDNISAAATKTTADNQSRVIGLTTIPYSDMLSYGMKAQYAAGSTKENPIIQVTSNYGEETVSYNVNVNEVNPQNASQLEMFALLSYADEQGISNGGTFGSYHQMKTYSYNACSSGYIAGYSASSFFSYETFMTGKFNWSGIISRMMEDYLSAGIYAQSGNCKNLLDVFKRFETNDRYGHEMPEEDDLSAEKNSPHYFIRAKINEMYDKVMNNEIEESFQIGANSFTVKEWNKLIEEFDDIQEKMRELMREEQAKRQEKKEEREEIADSLVESLKEKDKNI